MRPVCPLFGQVTLGTGSAGGLVRDASGALIAGAKVTLTEESKRLAREAETDAEGSFLFPSVTAGSYSLQVQKLGFNTYRMEQLRIEAIALSGPNTTGSQYVNHLPNRVCDGRNSQLSNDIRNNGFLWFDPGCFPVPPVGYFGNSGRTVIYGPGVNNWDLALEKSFPLAGQATRLQVRAESFNAWNHAQFGQPDGNAGDGATFGRISSTGTPRLMQLAVKVVW